MSYVLFRLPVSFVLLVRLETTNADKGEKGEEEAGGGRWWWIFQLAAGCVLHSFAGERRMFLLLCFVNHATLVILLRGREMEREEGIISKNVGRGQTIPRKQKVEVFFIEHFVLFNVIFSTISLGSMRQLLRGLMRREMEIE